jgi:tyrosine-protein kinase Etk/Wzc
MDRGIETKSMSVWDLISALRKHSRIVVGFPAFIGVLAIAAAFFLPKWFTGTARILPPQQSQSNALAILGQLGPLATVAGQSFGVRNPSDVYVAMLKSRTVADAIIKRFDLVKVYGEDTLVDTRKELASHAVIGAGRDGVISIEVEDQDPQRAADIANAFVYELSKLTLSLAVTEASQRRLFFESQLAKAKNDLAEAEHALKAFNLKAGLVDPQGQVSITVATAAALRAQIAAKEIQLSAMRSFATGKNPDLERTQQELVGLRGELAKIQRKTGAQDSDVLVGFGQAPELGLEYVRKYRDVRYYETLFEVLAKQYEIARIDEAKDAHLIQVLDAATVPDKRSRPMRAVIVIGSLFLAIVIAVVTALILETNAGSRETK